MIENIDDFLTGAEATIPVFSFLFNLVLSALLAFLLSKIYVRYGNSLSNRTHTARNFILLSLTTMLVISIVKSSLALSLGLVGALSIIRFRAAIKEPEELTYLFLSIAIGLGMGANQAGITILAFISIAVVIMIMKRFSKKLGPEQNLHLTLHSHKPGKVNGERIIEVLREHCRAVDLRRFDESAEVIEMSFIVEADGFEELNKAKAALQELDSSLKITFLDNKGLF